MTVGELKAKLDGFGDHLEVLADDNARMRMIPLVRARAGTSNDGMAAVILELE